MKCLSGFLAFLLTLSLVLNTGVRDVVAAITDVTLPTVKSIIIDKTEVQPEDTILVQVEAEDESGISSCKVSFHSEFGNGPHTQLNGNLHYNPDTDKYQALFLIDHQMALGKWFLSYVKVTDNVGNYDYFSPSEYYVSFTVNEDTRPPEAPIVYEVTDQSESVKGATSAMDPYGVEIFVKDEDETISIGTGFGGGRI